MVRDIMHALYSWDQSAGRELAVLIDGDAWCELKAECLGHAFTATRLSQFDNIHGFKVYRVHPGTLGKKWRIVEL